MKYEDAARQLADLRNELSGLQQKMQTVRRAVSLLQQKRQLLGLTSQNCQHLRRISQIFGQSNLLAVGFSHPVRFNRTFINAMRDLMIVKTAAAEVALKLLKRAAPQIRPS